MIKNIVFDIGNVLVKFQPDQAMRELGIEEEKIPKMAQATYSNPIWGELDRGVIPEAEIIDKMVTVAPEYEEEIRLFFRDGKDKVVKTHSYAKAWIEELQHNGYKVYLLSNYPENYFELHRKSQLDFANIVDGMIISGMVKMVKPNADIYECLFDTYNLKPEECVFLDDRPENIEGGEKLGMRGIVFESYEDAKTKLERMLRC